MIEDELAIRNLIAAYSDAVNRGDVDGMAAVYAENGILNVFGGADNVGHDAIRSIFRGTLATYRWIFQMTHSVLIQVEGSTAKSRCWVSEQALGQDGNGTQFLGLYQDELVRGTDGWRFARRRLERLYLGRPVVDGKSFALPSFTPGLGISG